MQEEFRLPRLAAVYDVLDDDRSDLDHYVAIVAELGARRVLDVGCGTGTLAVRLAGSGLDVTGVDPARASLEVARAKPGADAVTWVEGDAGAVTTTGFDVAVLTANVAMAIDDAGWPTSLAAVHSALVPRGHLVFETRRPEVRAWERWTRAQTETVTPLPAGGTVRSWVETTDVRLPEVALRWTYEFEDETLTSTSVLRFRDLDEITSDLRAHGFGVVDVRDAPDRPGREFVVLAEVISSSQ